MGRELDRGEAPRQEQAAGLDAGVAGERDGHLVPEQAERLGEGGDDIGQPADLDHRRELGGDEEDIHGAAALAQAAPGMGAPPPVLGPKLEPPRPPPPRGSRRATTPPSAVSSSPPCAWPSPGTGPRAPGACSPGPRTSSASIQTLIVPRARGEAAAPAGLRLGPPPRPDHVPAHAGPRLRAPRGGRARPAGARGRLRFPRRHPGQGAGADRARGGGAGAHQAGGPRQPRSVGRPGRDRARPGARGRPGAGQRGRPPATAPRRPRGARARRSLDRPARRVGGHGGSGGRFHAAGGVPLAGRGPVRPRDRGAPPPGGAHPRRPGGAPRPAADRRARPPRQALALRAAPGGYGGRGPDPLRLPRGRRHRGAGPHVCAARRGCLHDP